MKEYRATTTLSTKGGLIRKGEPVPKSYPRFDEGIRRGWIILVENKLVDVKIPEPFIEEPIPEMTISEEEPKIKEIRKEAEASMDELDLEPAVQNRTIESLEFLAFGRCEVLHAEGIYTLEDLRGKSITDLTNIKGVGFATANKLMGAFDEYNNSVGDDEDGD